MEKYLNDTKSESPGIIVACDDFVLMHDLVNSSNKEIMHRYKSYFTFEEYENLLHQKELPQDWRLPTKSEAECLIEQNAGNNATTSLQFVERLSLKYGGHIDCSQMEIYNKDPTEYNRSPAKIIEITEKYAYEGYYLINAGDSQYEVLSVSKYKPPELLRFNSRGGAKIRLVYIA